MTEYYKTDPEWFTQELLAGQEESRANANYDQEFPFQVDLVDQFEGHCEDGYSHVRRYRTLPEAVAVARRITEEAILSCGSVYSWRGMGDAGLVYHEHLLVWDGIREYTNSGGSEETVRALAYAKGAHVNQFRKGTATPYITHPIGVADILKQCNCANKLVSAGYLHDTIEDTKVTYENLKEEFGLYIAELVKGLSEPNQKASWKERKTLKLEYLKTAPHDVLIVSCADKLDNMRAIYNDLIHVGDELWKRFNATKEEQRWYYCSLRDLFKSIATSEPLKTIASKLEEEVNSVFK